MQELSLTQQRELVAHYAERMPAPVEIIETHISWVLLSGERAYKLKKALNLGFLDYSTLARRRFCCLEELRLNRRTAPELYLAVEPIGGTPSTPRPECEPAIEYVVVMRRFRQEQLLDARLHAGQVGPEEIDRLADTLARFHAEAAIAAPDSPYGVPEQIHQPMADNFDTLSRLLTDPAQADWLTPHTAWVAERWQALQARLALRHQQGFVRECHGDLHLGNLALLEGKITPFDGIEFNPALRWIDVMNELAFLAMDLEARGVPGYARRVVSRYLERSGDYGGLALVDLYRHYRAMVRAKVGAIRLAQPGIAATEHLKLIEDIGAYFTLAQGYMRPPRPGLALTVGPSGSGKSMVAQALVESLPRAVRLRSDVERKRLFGLKALDPSGSGQDAGIYTAGASDRTYARLLELARTVIEGGYTAVVDATFLEPSRRAPFAVLARQLGVPFALLEISAPAELLRQRVGTRRGDPSEATLAVLEAQLQHRMPLQPEEQSQTIPLDTSRPLDTEALLAQLEQHGFSVR